MMFANSTTKRAWLLLLIAFAATASCRQAAAQSPMSSAEQLQHDRVYMYLLKDGSCEFGDLANATASTLTIQQNNKPPLTIDRTSLLQIAQANELFYSARSSWSDVQNAKLYLHESMSVLLKNGRSVTGKPKTVTSDALTLERPFSTKTINKSDIHTVTLLKLRPATASFEFVQEEAGFFQIFYPEFYQRTFAFEGKVQVQLYDSSLPEDDSPGVARCFPARPLAAQPQNP